MALFKPLSRSGPLWNVLRERARLDRALNMTQLFCPESGSRWELNPLGIKMPNQNIQISDPLVGANLSHLLRSVHRGGSAPLRSSVATLRRDYTFGWTLRTTRGVRLNTSLSNVTGTPHGMNDPLCCATSTRNCFVTLKCSSAESRGSSRIAALLYRHAKPYIMWNDNGLRMSYWREPACSELYLQLPSASKLRDQILYC